jgi:hypothetical protein
MPTPVSGLRTPFGHSQKTRRITSRGLRPAAGCLESSVSKSECAKGQEQTGLEGNTFR